MPLSSADPIYLIGRSGVSKEGKQGTAKNKSAMNKSERDVGVEEEKEEEDCEQGDEEFRPLYANEPFFHAIMTRSHVKPSCNMVGDFHCYYL